MSDIPLKTCRHIREKDQVTIKKKKGNRIRLMGDANLRVVSDGHQNKCD